MGACVEQKAQKYFVDAELTSMVCEESDLTDEEEETLKVCGWMDV